MVVQALRSRENPTYELERGSRRSSWRSRLPNPLRRLSRRSGPAEWESEPEGWTAEDQEGYEESLADVFDEERQDEEREEKRAAEARRPANHGRISLNLIGACKNPMFKRYYRTGTWRTDMRDLAAGQLANFITQLAD